MKRNEEKEEEENTKKYSERKIPVKTGNKQFHSSDSYANCTAKQNDNLSEIQLIIISF